MIIVCSNPRCRKEFEESIRLTILSVTPPKQYEACPYCFSKLEQEPPIEQETIPEPQVEQEEVIDGDAEIAANLSENTVLEKGNDSGPGFFKKVKSLIPRTGGLKKGTRKEPEAESTVKKEEPKEAFQTGSSAKEESKSEDSTKKESGSLGCPEAFGYLSNRPKDVPIPQGCLSCLKMVDCMLSPKDD